MKNKLSFDLMSFIKLMVQHGGISYQKSSLKD